MDKLENNIYMKLFLVYKLYFIGFLTKLSNKKSLQKSDLCYF